MAEEVVVLVDSADNPLGTAPKLLAHETGRLHRAISVIIVNGRGDMLLQRRATGKYHSGGLWSNACCSHPRPGEPPHAAAARRLTEEMGMKCPIEYSFSFIYRADLGSGLTEHELDHVFVGVCGDDPRPDRNEVAEWRWAPIVEIEREIVARPDIFTAWFPIAFQRYLEHVDGSVAGRDPARGDPGRPADGRRAPARD